MTNCEKCNHSKDNHRDNIYHGDIGCTCMKFEDMREEVLMVATKLGTPEEIHSRTDIPLPMFITTYDNWTSKGWHYKKKWGKTQSEMVEFLSVKCRLFEEEIRIFLRCKAPSVRGRLSELRNR